MAHDLPTTFYAEALAAIDEAVIATDATGRVRYANSAADRLLGHPSSEAVGRPLHEVLGPRPVGDPEIDISRLVALAITGEAPELVLTRLAGPPVPVLIQASVLRDAGGGPYGTILCLRDQRAIAAARQASDQRQMLHLAATRRSSSWAFILDRAGVIRHVPAAMVETFGPTPGGPDAATAAWSGAEADDVIAIRAVIETVAGTPDRSEMVTFRLKDRGGSWRWVEDLFTNCLTDPHVGGILCNRRDVTDRVEAEQALQASESRWRAISQTAQEGIWAVDAMGVTRFANGKLASILGVPLDVVYQRPAPDILAPQQPDSILAMLRHGTGHGSVEYDLSYLHPDGRARTLHLCTGPMTDETGDPGALATITDVTEARHAERELRRRALHDQLTGLPNRTLLADRLERALARRTHTTSGSIAVLFADLDQFKLINDSWGHAAGDRLLIRVADRLNRALPPAHTLARFGGDEFIVVCEDTDEAQARAIAESLQHALARPFEAEGQRIHVTPSIGIACAPPHPAIDLLRYAEGAMYEAKLRGRARVHVFDSAPTDVAAHQLTMSNNLREALDQGQLVLHYQPMVELETGRLLGLEALARWVHPTLGPIAPATFVKIAEASGMAARLDRWALAQAVVDAERLRTVVPAGLRMAINISARHVLDPALEDAVLAAQRADALAACQLVLELTENAVMNNPDEARKLLRRLKASGVETAIDDFGTGHSSLAHLRNLSIATLKIDRAFIADITHEPDSLAIAASIIKLADALQLQTVAEGIETIEQLTVLRELGCHAGQGFLWSPALPPDDLAALLTALPAGRFPVARDAEVDAGVGAAARVQSERGRG